MALRKFVDTQGRRWQVWETVPARAEGLGELRGGWLTFDDGAERRRLAPVPEGWAELPDARLALLVRVAQPSLRGAAKDRPDRRRAERRTTDRRLRDRRKPPN